jgi:hypothetical protein
VVTLEQPEMVGHPVALGPTNHASGSASVMTVRAFPSARLDRDLWMASRDRLEHT